MAVPGRWEDRARRRVMDDACGCREDRRGRRLRRMTAPWTPSSRGRRCSRVSRRWRWSWSWTRHYHFSPLRVSNLARSYRPSPSIRHIPVGEGGGAIFEGEDGRPCSGDGQLLSSIERLTTGRGSLQHPKGGSDGRLGLFQRVSRRFPARQAFGKLDRHVDGGGMTRRVLRRRFGHVLMTDP